MIYLCRFICSNIHSETRKEAALTGINRLLYTCHYFFNFNSKFKNRISVETELSQHAQENASALKLRRRKLFWSGCSLVFVVVQLLFIFTSTVIVMSTEEKRETTTATLQHSSKSATEKFFLPITLHNFAKKNKLSWAVNNVLLCLLLKTILSSKIYYVFHWKLLMSSVIFVTASCLYELFELFFSSYELQLLDFQFSDTKKPNQYEKKIKCFCMKTYRHNLVFGFSPIGSNWYTYRCFLLPDLSKSYPSILKKLISANTYKPGCNSTVRIWRIYSYKSKLQNKNIRTDSEPLNGSGRFKEFLVVIDWESIHKIWSNEP